MTGWFSLLALGWAATASPAPIPLRIEFEAPPDCSSASAFYAGVRARTDRIRPALAGESGVLLRVRLTRGATGVHGELGGFDEQGKTEKRAVHGDTCAEVVEALSLTAALALDPNARFTTSSPSLATGEDGRVDGETPRDAPSEKPFTDVEEPRSARPSEEREDRKTEDEHESSREPGDGASMPLFLELGAHAMGMEVLAADLSVGGAVFLRLGLVGGVFSPSLAVSVMQVRNDVLGSPLDANVALTGVALTVCPLRFGVTDAIRVEPCAHGVGGLVNVAGRNITRPESVVRTWWSAGPLARAAAALGSKLSLELELGVDLPLAQRRFITRQPDELVTETPTLAPVAAAGVAYTF